MPTGKPLPLRGSAVLRCRELYDTWAGREKKTLYASERDEAARRAWRASVQQFNPQDLVFGAELVIAGAVDGEVFEAWVEQVLLPWLHPGQVVIWDNLRVHYRTRVRQLIEQVGCTVVFLPAYSPDFSPIENAFSKLKTYLKAAAARTKQALLDGIAQALRTISFHDILGWFNHCGYPLAKPL